MNESGRWLGWRFSRESHKTSGWGGRRWTGGVLGWKQAVVLMMLLMLIPCLLSSCRSVQCLPAALPQLGHLWWMQAADHPRKYLPLGHAQPPSQACLLALVLTTPLWTRCHTIHLRGRPVWHRHILRGCIWQEKKNPRANQGFWNWEHLKAIGENLWEWACGLGNGQVSH